MKRQRRERCYVCNAPVERARELVSVPSAMRICRVARSTIHRWMDQNLVEWIVLPSGSPRIYLDSLFRDPPYRPKY